MEAFLRELQGALEGTTKLILGTDPAALPPLPDDVDIVLTTSGSTTGRGRAVGLSRSALISSARATHSFLGGPGQWLLTLPHTHVAGVQVCARSLLAGHKPISRGEQTLSQAIGRMDPRARHYTSLVPTQLVRILQQRGPDLDALAQLHGILLGGAAVDPTLLHDARSAGLRVHTTYGSTETSGGCVYDGLPLTGVEVRIDGEDRVLLGGPTIAWGYLEDAPPDNPLPDFFTEGGTRWFRTSDLGRLTPTGHLEVLGRADDAIISGGVNVHPVAVENAIRQMREVTDCVVVGLPSKEWGAELASLIVLRHGEEDAAALLKRIRTHTRSILGVACAPRAVVITSELPTRGPGKVDRQQVIEVIRQELASGGGARYIARGQEAGTI